MHTSKKVSSLHFRAQFVLCHQTHKLSYKLFPLWILTVNKFSFNWFFTQRHFYYSLSVVIAQTGVALKLFYDFIRERRRKWTLDPQWEFYCRVYKIWRFNFLESFNLNGHLRYFLQFFQFGLSFQQIWSNFSRRWLQISRIFPLHVSIWLRSICTKNHSFVQLIKSATVHNFLHQVILSTKIPFQIPVKIFNSCCYSFFLHRK